jgi:hypothetical protein
MNKNLFRSVVVVVFLFLIALLPGTGKAQGFAGTWHFDKAQSKNADFFDGEALLLKITTGGVDKMTIEQVATTEYDTRITKTFVDMNGPETTSTWPQGDLPIFGYEAVAIGNDQTVMTRGVQGDDRSSFDLTSVLNVTVSQGYARVVVRSHYQLSSDNKTLTVTITRDSRGNGQPVVYVFHRAD